MTSPIKTKPFLRSKSNKRAFAFSVMTSLTLFLAGCGGTSEPDDATIKADKPQTQAEAVRFLTQATFGPSPADVARVKEVGYSKWIDEQLAMPLNQTHVDFMAGRNAEIQRDYGNHPNAKARSSEMVQSFYTHALSDPAQLRQRIAFALSEIFVVSMMDGILDDKARIVASYMDMLTQKGTGSYRALLEGVALHPAMGVYLSSRGNQKEDPTIGRVPDENFAREVMQLFSIGLYQLNPDGTLKKNAGRPIETYNSDDIKGMAKVFTGWSLYVPNELLTQVANAMPNRNPWPCFFSVPQCRHPDGEVLPMMAYPDFHSTAEKRIQVLNLTLPATPNKPDPAGDLRIVLDKLAQHPNVAPFMSKQLIQRFVTSNPSPEYVQRIAQVFNSSGGNIGQVVKAILLDPEARGAGSLAAPQFGKIREPLLRMTALLRAFKHHSDGMTGARSPSDPVGTVRTRFYAIGVWDDMEQLLGQSPLRAPSVFNYFRPGYIPPQTRMGENGLVAPEMQITSEVSMASYMTVLNQGLVKGLGYWKKYDVNGDGVIDAEGRYDIQFDFQEEKALADKPADLVDLVAGRLLPRPLPIESRQKIIEALNTIALPLSPAPIERIDTARLNRVRAAVFLVMVTPEFIVQK